MSFRIRKQYFDAIVSGQKTVEYRAETQYWKSRVVNILSSMHLKDPRSVFPIKITARSILFNVEKANVIGVFLCGKRIHRRKIPIIEWMKTPGDFSAQGKRDVPTKRCYGFHLGEELKICDCVCGCQNIVENPMEGCCNYCNGGWCEGQ